MSRNVNKYPYFLEADRGLLRRDRDPCNDSNLLFFCAGTGDESDTRGIQNGADPGLFCLPGLRFSRFVSRSSYIPFPFNAADAARVSGSLLGT